MGTIFVFLFGALIGAILWQWFGFRALTYVFENKPVLLREIFKGLSPDAFKAVKDVVESEELRRKEI